MFNWNRIPKRTTETEANPSLPNRNEIGIPSPSVRIVAKLVQKGPIFCEAILHLAKEEMECNIANMSNRHAPRLIEKPESCDRHPNPLQL
jgi:hypothetical protein